MTLLKLLLLSLSLLSFPLLSPCAANSSVATGDDVAINMGSAPKPSSRVLLLRKAEVLMANVKDYGAKDNGSDATQAFFDAWEAVCSSRVPPILLVPAGGSYLLRPINFLGPCKSSVTVRIQGTILASANVSDWDGKKHRHWIYFKGVRDLHVEGGGTIDGNGDTWWRESCKINKSQPCTEAPTAITFESCNGLLVENLKFKNSQKMHVAFEQCNDVLASKLTISAPETSPNTDGIHVSGTNNIQINHCNIATGDDCISIVSGSQGVTIIDINCGPGHGISIGSLGKDKSKVYVSNVSVDTANLSGTENGVRIKTWQGGDGYAKNIAFRNIKMDKVKNPIIIDQDYCDSSSPCKQQPSAIAISDIKYENIEGTSATDVSITFRCSDAVPCEGIVLEDIDLVKAKGTSTKSCCNNVKLSKSGTVIPTPCAQSLQEDFKNLFLSYH